MPRTDGSLASGPCEDCVRQRACGEVCDVDAARARRIIRTCGRDVYKIPENASLIDVIRLVVTPARHPLILIVVMLPSIPRGNHI